MNLNRIGLLDDEENPLVNPQSALAQYQPQQVATAPQKPQGISLLQRLGMAFIPETMGAISNAKAQQAAPVDGGYEALAEYWAKQGNPEKAEQYMALSGIGVDERFGAMFEAEDGNTYQLRKGADPVLIGRTAPKIQVANGLVLKGGEVAGELPMTKEQTLAQELEEKRIEATRRGQDISANTAAAGQASAQAEREAAAAREKEKLEAPRRKRSEQAAKTLNIIKMADPLITGATGSVLGAARDMAYAAFGKTTPGAERTASLKALESALILNMPRMEGPQSDKDVALYRQSAAQLGDPNVPAAIKKAALLTIKRLAEQSVIGENEGGSLKAETIDDRRKRLGLPPSRAKGAGK